MVRRLAGLCRVGRCRVVRRLVLCLVVRCLVGLPPAGRFRVARPLAGLRPVGLSVAV
ncbi:hypothetical protein [Saccharothrix stipae]